MTRSPRPSAGPSRTKITWSSVCLMISSSSSPLSTKTFSTNSAEQDLCEAFRICVHLCSSVVLGRQPGRTGPPLGHEPGFWSSQCCPSFKTRKGQPCRSAQTRKPVSALDWPSASPPSSASIRRPPGPDYTADLIPKPKGLHHPAPVLDRSGANGAALLGWENAGECPPTQSCCSKSPPALAYATARARTFERSDTSSSTRAERNKPSGPFGVISVKGDS